MSAGKSSYQIIRVGDNPTIQYAVEELQRCLTQMMGVPVNITSDRTGIRVGLMSSFPEVKAPAVSDPKMDDAIDIDVKDGVGHISGINPRSVLLAVYRYLTEQGCRWVRPGKDGEYIPQRNALGDVKLAQTPSYRHRGICIEGAVSSEHVTDIIDWMPKVGFNAYFTQFREAYTFFARWYSHQHNPTLPGREISVEDAKEFTAKAVEEIEKRDLIYHAVGHGWTCEPFGISGLGWDRPDVELSPETTQYLAEVNGKRELWGGIPLNTNLCYGNPKVREIITKEIAGYAEKHPEIDIIHFWLADGSNNNCECELCRDTRPSDFFVQMLNELDGRLAEKGLPTKVVFLAYVDLLWPPEKEKIENQDRFILMFAPITRTYSHSFAVSGDLPQLPPFVRNKLQFPRSVEQNVAFLKAWQKNFTGDSFDFDYHLMWDHFKDPAYIPSAGIIGEDAKLLENIGLNGYMSCQVQRAFFPTGLPMTVLGRTLWDSRLTFDEISDDYFASAYGQDGGLVRDYLTELSGLIDPLYLRGEKSRSDKESAENFNKAGQLIAGFVPVIERNLGSDNECQARSWSYLKHHAEICTRLASALEARAKDDQSSARERWERTKDYVRQHEMEIHPALDVFFFQTTLGGLFR